MTDEDVIKRVSEMFGNKHHQFENGRRIDGTPGKPIYVTCVTGKRAVAFMEAILPFMGERRASKINEILQFDEAKPDPNESRRVSCKISSKSRKRNQKGQYLENAA